ncbi:Fic family protein [Bifidobacterium sp. SO1]|uniref:Fic family protein n=1 Tax=Bifidobacterium sp. SO1 TaxID=2809029 RepID=UPI001BDC39E6|nr:Fic family protein [Bifidobacterium sp. SO1]MBT1161845.1 Fic family protein [Bifidobacterium sp. SO1]
MTSPRRKAIEFAHDTAVERMYRTAGIELPGMTFPQTRDILMGMAPQGVDEDDVRTVVNIRDAWRLLFDRIDDPISADLLLEYNQRIGHWLFFMPGNWRTQKVGIGKSAYVPKPRIDYETDVRPVLESNERIGDPLDRAMNLFCDISRGQWFNDGNKRTALMAANHILIDSGIGTLGIEPSQRHEFGGVLVRFYETNDRPPFIDWMTENALTRIPDGC